MAARMQQRNTPRRQRFQRSEHTVEINTQAFWVEIRISMYLETGTGENRHVVVPRWVADPHFRIREIGFQEISTDFQCAGTAHGLNRRDTALLYCRMLS